jgi:hypothetical protein
MPTKADFIEQGRRRFEVGGSRPLATKHWSGAALQEGWDAAAKEVAGETQPASIAGLTSPTGRMVSGQPNLQSIPTNSPEAKRVRDAFQSPKLTARQEHIRCLRGETHRKSITVNRLLRLNHKIQVLEAREALI